MDLPTPDAIRARSELLSARYPDDEGGPNDTKLATEVSDAAGLVASLTCRKIGDAPGEEVPTHLRGLAVRALAHKVEHLVERGTVKSRKGAATRFRLRSFQAGPYSESYFGPEDAAKAKVLDPDPDLHNLLWALATEDCRADWLALWGGEQRPAAATQEFNYRSRLGGY